MSRALSDIRQIPFRAFSSNEIVPPSEDQTLFYPFFYQPATSSLEDGWTAFRPEVEFSQLVQPHDDWRLSYVNQEFTVCPTYPAAVVVPRSVDDDVLVAAAAFRAGGRFPVLSYRHDAGVSLPSEKSIDRRIEGIGCGFFFFFCFFFCDTQAVLMRSSQPVSGANVKRCREDEKLLNSVLKPGMRGYIIDTRHHSAVQTPKVISLLCQPTVDPLWTPCGPPVDPCGPSVDPHPLPWTQLPVLQDRTLWTPCGPPVDPLRTLCGPPSSFPGPNYRF